jgi:prepilin-type N-terminal cleavage/methylation domain-containing protein
MKSINQGFTLLEILLCVAMIGIIAGVTAPLYNGMLTKNDLDIATTTVVQSVRRAQILSQGMERDSSWGVKVQSGSIVIFKGTSYATRDTTLDETTPMPTIIGVSGTTEYVFNELTGTPQTTGSLTLTSNSSSKTITINAKGTTDF